jgi:hypothetical protein
LRSLLIRWHLLSLDAPTVAALWTLFLARPAHVALPWRSPAAMFVAVWMLYAADRLLDARSATGLEDRHRFHHLHRSRFLAVIVLGALALAALLLGVDDRVLKLYALLATLLAAWLMLVHARPSAATARLPKELAVGVFFSAAVFIPTVARAPQLRPALVPAAALLAAVCTLNCLCIYAWEHTLPRGRAHWTTRWATRHLGQLAVALMVLGGLAGWLAPAASRPAAVACGLSSALLWLLDRNRKRFAATPLRAAADLALLTPLVVAPFFL